LQLPFFFCERQLPSNGAIPMAGDAAVLSAN
jgi:hypothetical protein